MTAPSHHAPDSSIRDEGNHAWKRLELLVDLYKHHFELFLKGYVIYLAAVGTTAGVALGQGVAGDTKPKLFAFMAVISLLAFTICVVSFLWVRRFETSLHSACDAVTLDRLPTFGVKAVVLLAAVGSAVLSTLSIGFMK